MPLTEEERVRSARLELAKRLGDTLPYALNTNLSTEAALIAKLIEAILTNTTVDLLIKLKTKPDA